MSQPFIPHPSPEVACWVHLSDALKYVTQWGIISSGCNEKLQPWENDPELTLGSSSAWVQIFPLILHLRNPEQFICVSFPFRKMGPIVAQSYRTGLKIQ